MGSGTPLLNEYKQEFFKKRFPQTVLGGMKLKLGYDAPAYVYLNQVLLFICPWLIGGIFTALAQYDIITDEIAMYVFGAIMCLYVLLAQGISRCIGRKASSVAPILPNMAANMLADDDEIMFESCCGSETFKFVVSPKKYVANIIIHAIVAGIMCGMGVGYLLPSTLNTLFNDSLAATILLYIFSWLTLLIAQYPLTVGAPPETAVYRTTDNYEINTLTRPFYVIICLLIGILATYYPRLQTANQALHIVCAVLPLLWTVGLLPPVDVFFLWLFEQVLVFVFGGSPMASDIRLCLILLASITVYILVYFLPLGYATIAIMAAFGYILSIDLGGLTAAALRMCKKPTTPPPSEHSNHGFLWQWTSMEALFHLGMLAVAGGGAVGFNYAFTSGVVNTSGFASYLGYTVLGLLVLAVVLADIQRVYVCLGLWRNKLFPSSVARTALFKKRKKKLAYLGYIRRAIIDFLGPLLMLVYVSAVHDVTSSGSTIQSNPNTTAAALLGANRAYRWIWQSSQNAMLEISVVEILRAALPSGGTWESLGVGVQLLILSFCRDRLAQIINKTYFWFTTTVFSWRDKKQRLKSTATLIALNFFLFPIALAVIVGAALLSAPLLPLFTIPLFLIGYPRPQRSWPGPVGSSQNICPDTVYYQQVAPHLARALHEGFASGSIGSVSPGRHLLLRFQDRLVWVQVLEQGYLHCQLSIKGLELQETSCHTAEALRVDDMIEVAFEAETTSCCTWIQHPLDTLRPYDTALVSTYSDARNQLTGVIDAPDTLRGVDAGFMKALLWGLLLYTQEARRDGGRPHSARSEVSSLGRPLTGGSISRLTPRNTNNNNKTGKGEAGGGEDDSSSDWDDMPGNKRSGSLGSLADSIWSNDNDSLLMQSLGKKKSDKVTLVNGVNNHTEKGGQSQPAVAANTSKKGAENRDSTADIDDLFNTLDIGMPAVDVQTKSRPADCAVMQEKLPSIHQKSTTAVHSAHQHLTADPSTVYSNSGCAQLAPPALWLQGPVTAAQRRGLASRFPEDWYRHLVGKLVGGDEGGSVAEDSQLRQMYCDLVMTCYHIVNVAGLAGTDPVSAGPSHVSKVYSGNIPWSPAADWLEDERELLQVVLKAFRFAVKLGIDEMLLGAAGDAGEVYDYFREYEDEWYLGADTDVAWHDAIVSNRPQLFSLSHNTTEGTYHSRTLTCQETPVYICGVNEESTRGQWANLALELLYLTNDDEERYSIQAHPTVLRNITVQAADPPLGYPIYSSQPISTPTL